MKTELHFDNEQKLLDWICSREALLGGVDSDSIEQLFVTGVDRRFSLLGAKILANETGLSTRLFHFTDINSYSKSRSFTEDVSRRKHIKLLAGDEYDISKLKVQLSKLGYRLVRRVMEQGEFSVLGDIVIVFPYHASNIVRASFWDKEIESIELIESKNRTKLKSTEIYRISGRVVDEEADFSYEQIDTGTQFITVVAFEQSILRGSLESLKGEYDKLGIVWKELRINSIAATAFVAGKPDSVKKVVSVYEKQGYEIVHLDWDLARRIGVRKGFVIENIKTLFLTEYELSGRVDLAQYDKRNQIMADRSVSIGDMVVHADHGIAIYEGIVNRKSPEDHHERAYLELRYAGNDRLFIPVEQSDRVTLYIGVKRQPKGLGRQSNLTKLNSGGWSRSKKAAQIEAERIAAELLRIESVRRSCNIDPIIRSDEDERRIEQFIDGFEYTDTDDQRISTLEIMDDLKRKIPMDRLLVGDVGFGKTEVALRAAFAVINAGGQVAFLAPTTILVSQHIEVIRKRFARVKLPAEGEKKMRSVRVESLSRLNNKAEREAIYADLRAGKIDIVVGTHSILSDAVRFAKLGLVIIDEEQKFGVKQKEKLKSKRVQTHVLSMSATPIPRSLSISLAGIRDISILSTPIPGRLAIKNIAAKFDWEIVRKAIEHELSRSGQLYFLHNRVRELEEYAMKIQAMFPDATISTIHGRMSAADLAAVMGAFARGDIDILVCTTIIENGIDLPNVNTLIINTPERLGLSQMYQIRGRIGRSDRQAWTYILYKKLKGDSAVRIKSLEEHQQLGAGFMLASRDLEIRGAGNILGKEQSGMIASVGYELFMRMVEETINN